MRGFLKTWRERTDSLHLPGVKTTEKLVDERHQQSVLFHFTYRGHLISDTLSDQKSREYSPVSPPSPELSSPLRSPSGSKVRQLVKDEEKDPFRWGHSGYKELYPEKFVSTDDESDKEAAGKRSRSRKRKKKHKEKKGTKVKKSKLQSDQDTDSARGVDSVKKHRRKKRKKKAREKEKSDRDLSNSSSDELSKENSPSFSDTRHKKRKTRHKRS